MATKGQKYKTINIETKEFIIKECLTNFKSIRFVGKKLGISHNTVYTIIKNYKKQGSLTGNRKKGRPKLSKLSELEKLRLENEILKKFQAFLKEQQGKK